jgi:hypothetical protein
VVDTGQHSHIVLCVDRVRNRETPDARPGPRI